MSCLDVARGGDGMLLIVVDSKSRYNFLTACRLHTQNEISLVASTIPYWVDFLSTEPTVCLYLTRLKNVIYFTQIELQFFFNMLWMYIFSS